MPSGDLNEALDAPEEIGEREEAAVEGELDGDLVEASVGGRRRSCAAGPWRSGVAIVMSVNSMPMPLAALFSSRMRSDTATDCGIAFESVTSSA